MNPWHLFWIIPVTFYMGFATCALMVASKEDREGE